MLAGIEQRLVATTGDDVATWSARVRETGLATEPEVRAWLAGRGVTGYGQMVVVMERFGSPDFLTASADELIDALGDDPGAAAHVADLRQLCLFMEKEMSGLLERWRKRDIG